MSREPHKRIAAEPASALFETEEEAPSLRPSSLIMGTVLVVARALGSLLWGVVLLTLWPQISPELDLSAAMTRAVLLTLLGIAAAWMLFLLLLARLIWRGNNSARMMVLFGATVSILSSAASYFAAGEEITVATTLLTLSLDILILLALSSRDARTWSRQRHRN